jgi:hypothetical protein
MKTEERAVQLWSVLVLAARNQQLLSYGTVEQITGIAQPGIGKMLSPIQRYCKNNRLPRLTSIVITETTGLPGEKFTEDSGPGDIFADQAKVFVYDWFTRKAPTSEDFKVAMQD